MNAKLLRSFQLFVIVLLGLLLLACAKPPVKPWGNTYRDQIVFRFVEDIDQDKNEIEGDLELDLKSAPKPTDQTHYVVYWSRSAGRSGKSDKLVEVPVADLPGNLLYHVPANTKKEDNKYFLLYVKDKTDKETYVKSAEIIDKSPPEPTEAEKQKAAAAAEVVRKQEAEKVEAERKKAEEAVAAEQEETAAEEAAEVTAEEAAEVTAEEAAAKEAAAEEAAAAEAAVAARVASAIKIITVENVLFDFDKSIVKDEYKSKLEETFADATDKDAMKIKIAGHADDRGSNEYNLALGEKRAYSVKVFLISLGFLEDNLEIISFGEEKPLDTGQNEEAWATNRRAESDILD